MALCVTSVSLTLIKYHINESHSRSVVQFVSDRGNPWKEEKLIMVQGGRNRHSYCTVAKDVSASAIQTISRQHSGSSLQQPLSRRRRYSGGGSGSQLSALSPSCTNSLSVRDAWA